MTSDDPSNAADEAAKIEQKTERARLRRSIERFGWKWVNRTTAEIRVERALHIGTRSITVRGRVPIEISAEITSIEGEQAAAAIVDPAMEAWRYAVEGAARKILSSPDDVVADHVFDRPAFFSALEDARRGLIHTYQLLENRRIDDRVDAELGLHFYLEGFTTDERTFEYFVGPTNSGKTHAAIELMQAADRAVYLAPLRLLALEVYERLNDLGVAASLVTGEERILHPYARHTSSTVEMVDLGHSYDVAIVDETRMLEDAQRGWAWTLAISAVRAKHVVMCGSEEGLRAARRLLERLGLPLEVRRFERKSPLRVVPAVALTDLRPGDAVVGFSRNAVIELQGEIGRLGYSSAAIYGSLSPLVRRREADRFRTGAAQILVATDAIGLGLNLPIRRIIFAVVEKYDGISERLLSAQEIRQIAGRAGRYGLHEEGLVTAIDARDVPLLRRSIERHEMASAEGPIWISPTDEHLRRLSAIIGTNRVGRLLQFFNERVLRDADTGLRIADLTDTIDVALALELSDDFLKLPFEVRCTYTRAPVTTRGNSLAVLSSWGVQHALYGSVAGTELMMEGASRDRLLLYEDRSRLATLYLWLANRFPGVYSNQAEIATIREGIDDDIHGALLKRGSQSKGKHRTLVPARRRRHGPRR